MTTEELKVSILIPTSPNRIYAAWLDERQHSAFTGSRATVEPWVGGRFTAWDSYAYGTFVELDTGKLMAMTWRSTEFPSDAHDSRVEVRLEPVAGGTKVVITQTGIPAGQAEQYKKGWKQYYLDPMKKFFGKPGAMRDAIVAASKAGLLPVAGLSTFGARRGLAPASTAGRPLPAAPAAPAAPRQVRPREPSTATPGSAKARALAKAAFAKAAAAKPQPAKPAAAKPSPAKPSPAKPSPAKPDKPVVRPAKAAARKTTKPKAKPKPRAAAKPKAKAVPAKAAARTTAKSGSRKPVPVKSAARRATKKRR